MSIQCLVKSRIEDYIGKQLRQRVTLNMMLPSACFTGGMVLSGWYPVEKFKEIWIFMQDNVYVESIIYSVLHLSFSMYKKFSHSRLGLESDFRIGRKRKKEREKNGIFKIMGLKWQKTFGKTRHQAVYHSVMHVHL